jgi:DNA-binding MarR family transcriptional regulator
VGAHAASRFAERLAPLGLGPQHAGVLRLVGLSAGLSQRALGERLGVLPARLVALVDDLEQRDLLERRAVPQDRRANALHLTARGEATLADVGRVAREHGEALLAALDEKERRQLRDLLARVAADQGLTSGVHPGFRGRG